MDKKAQHAMETGIAQDFTGFRVAQRAPRTNKAVDIWMFSGLHASVGEVFRSQNTHSMAHSNAIVYGQVTQNMPMTLTPKSISLAEP